MKLKILYVRIKRNMTVGSDECVTDISSTRNLSVLGMPAITLGWTIRLR